MAAYRTDETGADSGEVYILNLNGDGTVSFRSAHGKYLVAESNGELNANRDQIGPWEQFRMDGAQ